jgi:hypothetical protein
VDTKKYIIETTGTGIAILTTTMTGGRIFSSSTAPNWKGSLLESSTNHLYRNNRWHLHRCDRQGWSYSQRVGPRGLLGDYDNDGWEDLYITYYGKNRLYQNEHGVFESLHQQAEFAGSGKAWGTGCAFVDYDRDRLVDLMVANYVDFDLDCVSPVSVPPDLERSAGDVRPSGTSWDEEHSLPQLGRREVRRCNCQSAYRSGLRHYAFSVSTFDYDDDG